MRVALLSDIHGNLVALEAIIADMARHGPFDEIVVAGDLVWAGPWPAEVVDRVREMKVSVIQGNTDAFFAMDPDRSPQDGEGEAYAMQRAWMEKQLGPARIAYLTTLPFSHRIPVAPDHDLLVVHANPVDMVRPISPHLSQTELSELLAPDGLSPDWGALAFGHLHIPYQRWWEGRLLVNVASAGAPRDGDQRGVYAILSWNGEQWQAEHCRVPYQVPLAAHQMHVCGMPRGKQFAERLMRANYSPW